MTFNEYQEATRETALYRETVKASLSDHTFLYLVLGLAGESGEVADKVKKIYRDNGGVLTDETKQELIKELGDILWYIARLSDDWGVPLERLAKMNIEKTHSRKRRNELHGDGDNR